MRSTVAIQRAIGLCVLLSSFACLGADITCAGATPLANKRYSQLAATPLVDTGSTPAAVVALVDPVGSEVRSLYLNKMANPLRQVQIDDVINEGKFTNPSIKFSAAESKRLQASSQCKASFDRLLAEFVAVRAGLGFDGLSAPDGLALFGAWALSPTRTPAELALAAPVLAAERSYDAACLAYQIPSEMPGDDIRRAVGVFVFSGSPVCTGFRMSQSTVLTARHCFITPAGELAPLTRHLQDPSQTEKLWFVYEGEPTDRFEVCRSSVPAKGEPQLYPERDYIRLTVAGTKSPPPAWEWAEASLGQSLYIRGYFPFGTESTVLGRLRATSSGGCAAMVVKGRCILHGCQSVPLMSGAPVFLRPEPGAFPARLKVAGVHLGAASLSDDVDPKICVGIKRADLPSGNFAFQVKEE